MIDRIEFNPRVCGGRPVIKGTRIPVEVILGQLADGESWDALLKGYAELTRDKAVVANKRKDPKGITARILESA